MLPLCWLAITLTSCGAFNPTFVGLPAETNIAFINLSRMSYAAFGVRVNAGDGNTAAFTASPLLPPGGIFRIAFSDLLGNACPDALDFQVFVYRRVNDDVPIGLDPTEDVEPAPIAVGQVLGVPACNVQPLVTYTVANWDAPEGTARVKFAQGSAVDTAITMSGVFPNADAAWEVTGVDPTLAAEPPPSIAAPEPISGRVVLANGAPVPDVGVLIRTFFRARLDDADDSNDPDSGFSDPIAFSLTGADGAFNLNRPPGGYRMEFFSDEFSFRPAIVDVETPLSTVLIVAEPL
jgi:hypothetical protein